MRSRTWGLIVVTAALWVALNVVARPGIGPRLASKPPVFELERYFGWPATYRAELWESDDPLMFARGKGSFRIYDPSSEMRPMAREFGRAAVAIDVLFVVALLIMTGVASEGRRRREWRRREFVAMIVCVLALLALYVASDSASVAL